MRAGKPRSSETLLSRMSRKATLRPCPARERRPSTEGIAGTCAPGALGVGELEAGAASARNSPAQPGARVARSRREPSDNVAKVLPGLGLHCGASSADTVIEAERIRTTERKDKPSWNRG